MERTLFGSTGLGKAMRKRTPEGQVEPVIS
jgi:hypothetical protein